MQNFFASIKRHKIISIIVVLLLVGGGYYIYTKTHPAKATVTYQTSPVTQGTITSSVSGTGQIAASNTVDINPQGSGTVTAVDVTEGQSVKAGQVIATLDESSAENQINSAKAALSSAQANLQSVMAGDTTQDLQLAQLSVQSASSSLANTQTNYTQVVQQQQLAVAKAYSNLLTDNLQANPSDTDSTVTVTISGSYTATAEGAYTITLYTAGDGIHYSSSGLGTANGFVNRGLPLPIGNGLYITFGTSGSLSAGTTWTISLPNTESASYVNDESSYNSAIQNQTQALQQAEAQIDSAQNSLQQAQLQLQEKQAPPTQAQLDTAQAQVQSAQVNLQTAQTAYDDNVIRAPFAGIISTLSLELGQQAGSGTAAATEITNTQIAQITLNEVDAAKVQVGQKATLTFSAVSGLTLTGEVAEVQTVGTVTQNVVNFPIKIALDAQDSRVKPGMSVSADIITAEDQNVLMAPAAAVKTSASGSYVQILTNGQPQNIPVTVGISSATETEISGNIQAGQEVVTATISSATTKSAAAASGSLLQSLGGGARTGAAGFGGGAGLGGGAARVVTGGGAAAR